jgi:CheY-like chemotaxis protein
MVSNSDVVVQRKRPLDGLHVLVVDDNEDTRDVLQAVLEADGATVSTAQSSGAALLALDAWSPNVMLIDIGMPIMNGFELVQQIRRRPVDSGGQVPAVALTGYISAEDRARATEAGFQAYLTKPVDERALVDAVRLLGRQQ